MEVTLKNVNYRYKNKKLLERINLKIEDNHITGIIGEYKSLLCELIDSLKKPSTGSILVGALEINKENLKTVRKEVSLIRQNAYDQFFTDNVKEEMMFLISRLNYKPRDLNKKMNQALLLVGLDKSYLNKSIQSLSSGEKKLFQVAISLIYNPSIIIFDEPFATLDYSNQKKLSKLIKLLKEKYNKTVIIASNNCDLLYELTDDIVILKKGHIIAADDTVKVYQDIELLKDNEIEMPNLVKFTMLARAKKVKLSYHRDIRDLIKDVYKHV